MSDVPLHRAERMLMVHVDVIKTLDLAPLSILDQRTIRAPEIAEASLPPRHGTLGSKFENLLLRRESRQSIAGHVDELAIGRVPHLSDLQAHRAEPRVVFSGV